MKLRPTLFAIVASVTMANADAPEIVSVTATQAGDSWTFSVALRHPDSGWDHYANGWEVLTPDGQTLGLRELTHPHVDEQPFERSLSGVVIPDGIDRVLIRARCNLNGWAMPRTEVQLR